MLSRVHEQLFAGLREHHRFAHPVQKATANLLFERLHGSG